MGSRSQNPRGTRVPAKKSVDPVKTPKNHTQNRKLVLFWTFSSPWNIPIVCIILDLLQSYANFSENFVFDPKSFLTPFKIAAAKKAVWSLRLNGGGMPLKIAQSHV